MRLLLREWGAITFVVTVILGAIVVAISLVVTGSHAPAVATLPPCPSYTPYVVTPSAKPTATPTPAASAAASASASASATAAPSASAGPTPTPFNPALANCPTPPLPPTSKPTPTPKPGATPAPTAPPPTSSVPTPLPT